VEVWSKDVVLYPQAIVASGVAGYFPLTSIAAQQDGGPLEFSLFQNYPNPANPTTTIAYVVQSVASGRPSAVSGKVRLAVYDLLGREVAVLVDGVQAPGRHQVVFNAANLASGIYVYRLIAGSFSASKTLTIIK
jgi:hypothetical protein